MNFLIIDDHKMFRDAACLLIENEGHAPQSSTTGETGLRMLKKDQFDAVLLEMSLGQENGLDVLDQIVKGFPGLPVIAYSVECTLKVALEAMRHGAVDFLEKPLTREQLQFLVGRLELPSPRSRNPERSGPETRQTNSRNPETILDFSAVEMGPLMETVLRAAKTPASILITGESGTGKSILARAVHNQSHLAGKPFITVSCASLSRELLESELFGHVRGSFTGAIQDHWGKVKAADGGTLFLDEIGDLPLEIQPRLLRLLQEREYERVGETVTRRANLRIIAATNRDLKKKLLEGSFREDLYFRLNVIAVNIPPLRQRHGDLERLANHYLAYFSRQCGRDLPKLSKAATYRLLDYSWPGNLRELRNAIERAVILLNGDEVRPEDLPENLDENTATAEEQLLPGAMISIAHLQRLHIGRVVARTASVTEAARVLGINAATIYRQRRRIGPVGNKIELMSKSNELPIPEPNRSYA